MAVRVEWFDQAPAEGKVELIRQADRWFICAHDLSPEMTYSYLDQPNPITALLDRIVKSLEADQERTKALLRRKPGGR